jgi:hypothetical protein
MKNNLNISIITNFGCRTNCWYCIWKGHELEKNNDETDWNKLKSFLYKNKDKGKVSVSGGGDCLYKYDKYKIWWDKLFKITDKLNMMVDVHSREKFINNVFLNIINRYVFSSDILQNDIEYLKYLSKLVKLRITHLVTSNTTFDLIESYLKFQKEINCQFTIKELVNFNDNGMYKNIKEKYPSIYYLDAKDYNIYYMPNNSIRNYFFKKEVEN